MSNFSATKRLRILPTNEVDDLFSRPTFNDDERLIWFELDQMELELLQSIKSLASKVNLIIQAGYFKAKHQLFSFTLEDVLEDTKYVMNRYFPNKVLEKSTLGREAKRLNQVIILKHYKFTLFSTQIHIPLLLEKAHSLCRISNDPLFLFRGLFDYLKTNKITIPGYTTFQQQIISIALNRENERLYSGLSLNMSLAEREALLALLDAEEDFYIITCLKKQPKNFKLTSIRKEVSAYKRILPLATCAMRILPILNLSKTAIHYYSSLVDHYTVQGLTRINENQTCLWLLCFVHQRYSLMLDNLTTMLIYTCNQYTIDIEKKASELLVVELKKPDDQGWQIAKTLRVFRSPETDFTKAFSYIKDDVHVFFPPDKMDHAIDVLEDNNKALKALEAKCFWLAVDELVGTYKQPLRLLIKTLTLNGQQHRYLQKAYSFLKGVLWKKCQNCSFWH